MHARALGPRAIRRSTSQMGELHSELWHALHESWHREFTPWLWSGNLLHSFSFYPMACTGLCSALAIGVGHRQTASKRSMADGDPGSGIASSITGRGAVVGVVDDLIRSPHNGIARVSLGLSSTDRGVGNPNCSVARTIERLVVVVVVLDVMLERR